MLIAFVLQSFILESISVPSTAKHPQLVRSEKAALLASSSTSTDSEVPVTNPEEKEKEKEEEEQDKEEEEKNPISKKTRDKASSTEKTADSSPKKTEDSSTKKTEPASKPSSSKKASHKHKKASHAKSHHESHAGHASKTGDASKTAAPEDAAAKKGKSHKGDDSATAAPKVHSKAHHRKTDKPAHSAEEKKGTGTKPSALITEDEAMKAAAKEEPVVRVAALLEERVLELRSDDPMVIAAPIGLIFLILTCCGLCSFWGKPGEDSGLAFIIDKGWRDPSQTQPEHFLFADADKIFEACKQKCDELGEANMTFQIYASDGKLVKASSKGLTFIPVDLFKTGAGKALITLEEKSTKSLIDPGICQLFPLLFCRLGSLPFPVMGAILVYGPGDEYACFVCSGSIKASKDLEVTTAGISAVGYTAAGQGFRKRG